jgi:hypothetical protein
MKSVGRKTRRVEGMFSYEVNRAGFEPFGGCGAWRRTAFKSLHFSIRSSSQAQAAAQNRRGSSEGQLKLWARRVFRPTDLRLASGLSPPKLMGLRRCRGKR